AHAPASRSGRHDRDRDGGLAAAHEGRQVPAGGVVAGSARGEVMPRLCILTQYFPPEMGAPQARLSELGEHLVERGWEVDVLTALPNYPTGAIFPDYASRG